MKLNRSQMVWRAAQDIGDGWLVNLGIGLPVAVADQVRACSPGIELLLLRAAPSMGPVSVAGLAPAAQPI